MNITITLTEEQEDAVQKRADAAIPPATIEGILQELALGQINVWVKEDYDAAVRNLGDMAAGMDYAARKSLIATVAASIPTP